MSQWRIVLRQDVLQSWLKVQGYTGSRLAKELGVSKSRISQLLRRDQEPSSRLTAGLLFITRLPFERLFAVRRNGRDFSKVLGRVSRAPLRAIETAGGKI